MSEQTPAYFFDGQSSRRHEVTLVCEIGGRFRIEGAGLALEYPLAEIRIAPKVGDIPRSLYFPNGAKCEVASESFVERLCEAQGGAGISLALHIMESRLPYALGALVLAVAAVWAGVSFGIPALAEKTASALPESANILLGQGALRALDQTIFSASKLGQSTRNRLTQSFSLITREAGGSYPYRLEFRQGGALGANAFALPSGTVVMTDELVALAHNEEELIGVLAHEVGHVVHRHAMRYVLQNSGVVLLLAAVVGDVSSITSLAGALPAILVQLKYSRVFELEADDHAVEYLRARNIPTRHFANFLARLQGEEDGEPPGYLSTHPPTGERLARIMHRP